MNEKFYRLNEKGTRLVMHYFEDENEKTREVRNIMLKEHDLEDHQLKYHLLICLKDMYPTPVFSGIERICFINFVAMLHRYAEATYTKESGEIGFWAYFVKCVYEILKNHEGMAADFENYVPDYEKRFKAGISIFKDDKASECIRMVYSFLSGQFNAVASIPSEEIEKVFNIKLEAVEARSLLNGLMEGKENIATEFVYENKDIVQRCKEFIKNQTPEKIYEYINKYISGQERAKQEFSSLCFEHVVRVANPQLKIRKSNYVMYGPTGCGKTELARVVKNILPVPVEILDASIITTNGFKGPDKEDIMFDLCASNPEIEHGIIILDEFDKLCIPTYDSHGGNVNKLIQGELLKMIEGTKLYRYKSDLTREMDTENITFICAGAFAGAFRKEIKNGMGFGSKDENLMAGKRVSKCLEEFGMIPELAGRICSSIPLNKLEEKDLYEILKNKENNCLDNIRKLYRAAYNAEIEFSDEALHEICREAAECELGARGLGGIVENICHLNQRKMYGKEKRVLRITTNMVRSLNEQEMVEY